MNQRPPRKPPRRPRKLKTETERKNLDRVGSGGMGDRLGILHLLFAIKIAQSTVRSKDSKTAQPP